LSNPLWANRLRFDKARDKARDKEGGKNPARDGPSLTLDQGPKPV
jgi:hypothetical protein